MRMEEGSEAVMSRSWSLGAILTFLVVAAPVLAFVDPSPDPDELELNRRRLEKWRADPEHYQRLQRDLKAFWELPAEKRGRLRQLDRSLHEADSFTQKRLWVVLERYSAWIEHLPETDRHRVEDADRGDRIRIIKELRDRQWVERQPLVVRKELEALAPEQRPARIAVLRKEEKERRLAWQKELRKLPKSIERPTRLVEFSPEIQGYVKDVLRPMLSDEEKSLLALAEGGDWPQLARVLVDLSEKHPLTLPWFPSHRPTRYNELHPEFKRAVPIADLEPRYKRRLQDKSVIGRWPDFAIEFTAVAREKKIELPKQLGPSRPGEFKPPLDKWVNDTLMPKLADKEKEELRRAEGRWPEYPKKLMELSRKYESDIPGMKLPGPKDFWDKARAALPEVPDHVLRDFVLMELSPEERAELLIPAEDPEANRERIREAYFKKKPELLKKQRQIDSRALSHPPASHPQGNKTHGH
jgi:hypothetical protein